VPVRALGGDDGFEEEKRRMKKMSLNLDQLTVESFEVSNSRMIKGTVRGHDVCSDLCTYSCNGTCGAPLLSAESECNVIPQSNFCGDTQDITGCQPCCV
jgi:hypothetical protein